MRKLLLLGLYTLLFSSCARTLYVVSYDIIPQPKEMTLTEKIPFMLWDNTVVYYEEGLQRESQFLCEYLNDL